MFSNSGAGGGASPGLLRRRYSVPETIMRKYRLAQQQSETEIEDGGRWSATGSGGRGACAWCGSRASVARREREHMRKSALLRLWGRAGASVARACPCAVCGPGGPVAPVGTRSLDASHTELRASPRRLRLEQSRERRTDGPPPSTSRVADVVPARIPTPRVGDRTVRTPVDSPLLRIDDCSLSDLSEPFTTSPPTMKEIEFNSSEPYARLSTGNYIDGRVSERSIGVENDGSNVPYVVPYMQPLTLETPSCDLLEIVVSETLEVRQAPAIINESPGRSPPRILKNQLLAQKKTNNIPIDEYVSNILVESLNSLSDQLDYMNASMGSDRKLSIVEKEIKVKLQNTGVNTIVHLSPTSNNQIIFGNEELYESDVKGDRCNNARDTCSSNIREETINNEMNNNLTSAESLREHDNDSYHKQNKTGNFLNLPSDTVNKAVLQQIQKLFKDELQSLEPEMNSPEGPLPGISHIEISNVDVFIDNNRGTLQNADTIEMQTNRNFEVLGGVGSCNYFQEVDDTAIVPRFSAFPHTESMEVNTSSSEDAEILGSECTSLVDSLDDPNSPRSILLRRSFNNRRSELVRSAIDVLDLLPENMNQSNNISPKEKSESFFIRIKDDDCDCEKENIVVADHMPETIKQRLYRRHRKRELRMECARRSKVKQLKRNDCNYIESQKRRKEVERESVILINTLIDDVIVKIAQDEYKCMCIKQKANKVPLAKSDENLSIKQLKRDSENNNNRDKKNKTSNVSQSYSNDLDKTHQNNEKVILGRLSLQAHTPPSPEDSPPMRIYQKSEIHDGNKCIEILEILEYVNSSQNSDTPNSDENHNLNVKNRKSRIPVPVNEKIQKVSKTKTQKSSKINDSKRSPNLLSSEKNRESSQLLANMLLNALGATSDVSDAEDGDMPAPAARRASVPCEARSRSNSLRFKNVFDIIPEEKSSLSIESTGDESAYGRRASAPSFCEDLNSLNREEQRLQPTESHRHRAPPKELRCTSTKSAGTSPMPELYKQATQVNVSAMTSPLRKSAGTSPIRVATATSSSAGCQQAGAPQRPTQSPGPAPVTRVPRSQHDEGSNGRRHSISTQHEPTRRLRGGRSETDTSPSVFRLKRGKKSNRQERIGTNSIDSVKQSSEDVPSMGEQERKKERAKIKEMLGDERRRRSQAKVEAETQKERRRRRDTEGKHEENVEEEWSSSESSGSLLCSLAPAWLTARRRRRRAAPTVSGEWAVTVAGSCPSALPNDVEMRLRFPERRLGHPTPLAVPASSALPEHHGHPSQASMPSSCHRAVECGALCSRPRGRGGEEAGRLTLTVKKEASDSSIVASKSVKKSSDLLPDLHTYRASRSNTRSSVKIPTVRKLFTWRRRLFQTQRGYSLHCWLPEEEPTLIRARSGLTVEGNAIVPRRKPRAPSMSERDLTRHTTRSFLPTHLRNIF